MATPTPQPEVPIAAQKTRGQQIFSQALQYASGSGLIILSSLISYPILTRLFTQSEYGLLALISNTVSLMVSFSKVGLQHAAVRFYAECPDPEERRTLYSTLATAPLINGLLLGCVAAVVSFMLPQHVLPVSMRNVILVASPIVALEATKMTILNFLRAARRSGRYAVLTTVDKYGMMGFSIVFLVVVRRGLIGFYLGWLIWSFSLVVVLLLLLAQRRAFRFGAFDSPLLKRALQFGAPLLLMEIGGLILTYGDRYIIAETMGTSPTGVYAAAYNFSMAVQGLLVTPLASLIFPWASEIWTKGSKEETSRFASKILSYFLAVGVPLIAGGSVLRLPIMETFASSRYNAAADLLPMLITAQVAFGVYGILTLGLFLTKRTITMAIQVVAATILNIGANLWFIPHYGLMGAAFTTLLAYVALIVIAMRTSLPLLPVRMDWKVLGKILASSAVMCAAILALPAMRPWQTLVVGTAVGSVTYGVLMIALDGTLRRFATGLVMPALSRAK